MNKAERDAQNWLNTHTGTIAGAREIVILGMGLGVHIAAFQKQWPDMALTVIDPRPELFASFQSLSPHTVSFVTSIAGLRLCRERLRQSPVPVPVLTFRPCWHPNTVFFEWALAQLLEVEKIEQWRGQSADFILESLFV
jgi:hypothetical protein